MIIIGTTRRFYYVLMMYHPYFCLYLLSPMVNQMMIINCLDYEYYYVMSDYGKMHLMIGNSTYDIDLKNAKNFIHCFNI